MDKRNSLKNILFAGHFAIDNIIINQFENRPSLGGSVTYCSLSLSKYTQNVSIKVFSNIGIKNFDISFLKKLQMKNVDVSVVKHYDTQNTTFMLDYFNHSRNLTLLAKSPNLNAEYLIESLERPPNVIALVPLCHEIDYAFVSTILKEYPNTIIGIDLQGFVRSIDKDGRVEYKKDDELISNVKNIIKLAGKRLILKGSEIEMKILSGEEDMDAIMNFFVKSNFDGLFIMTLGEMGSMVIKKHKELLKIPAFKPKQVLDETGAGDVYLAIFLYELINSNNTWIEVENAAYLASAAASFLVEQSGPKGFKSREKVVERVNTKSYVENSVVFDSY